MKFYYYSGWACDKHHLFLESLSFRLDIRDFKEKLRIYLVTCILIIK